MVNTKILLGIDIQYWALGLSFLALFIALLKDFILPLILKPKIVINYFDKEPFRRKRKVPSDPKGQFDESAFNERSPLFNEEFHQGSQICESFIEDASTGSATQNYISSECGSSKLKKVSKKPSNKYIDCCFLRLSVKNMGKRPAINCRCQIVDVTSSKGKSFDFVGFTLRWACRPESRLEPIKGERLNIGVGETEFLDFAMAREDDERIIFLKYHGEFVGLNDKLEPGDYFITLIFSGDNFKPLMMEFRLAKTENVEIDGIKLSKVKNK